MQFLGYFDRVAVINLPERTDRRKGVEQELKRLGLPIHAHKVVFFPAVKPADAGAFPTRGARGCFESHLAVLRAARADGLSNILILEDDFASSEELELLQSRLLAQLTRSSWDMVAFGHNLQSETPKVPTLVRPHATYRLTHCYAVNASCFDALISFLELVQSRPSGHALGGPMHYDGALDTFRHQHPERQVLIAFPSVAGQRSSRSDINPSRLERIAALRHLVELARVGLRVARSVLGGARKPAGHTAASPSTFPSVFPPAG